MRLDDPQLTARRREIVRTKPFLRRIYSEWYSLLLNALPPGGGEILELGSGGGFFKEYTDERLSDAYHVSTSDVLALPEVELVCPASLLPFRDGALSAIVMTNVFHHIPDCAAFLDEARRTLRADGVVACIEPWLNPWARFVYRNLHHEPIEERTEGWAFASRGPLSSANTALPYMVFRRDRDRLQAEFPSLRLMETRSLMPLSYLLSGGVSSRLGMPGWMYEAVRRAERRLDATSGMFAIIKLRRTGQAGP